MDDDDKPREGEAMAELRAAVAAQDTAQKFMDATLLDRARRDVVAAARRVLEESGR